MQTFKSKSQLMTKIITLLTIITLAMSVARAQNNWKAYDIDNKLSIKFPSEPQSMGKGGGLIAVDKDSSVYMAMVIDLGLDSSKISNEQLLAIFDKPGALNGLTKVMQSKVPDAVLSDIVKTSWKDFPCFYTEGTFTGKPLKLYCYMPLINRRLYMIAAAVQEDAIAKVKNDFWGSLMLN
jgi:hypothetical protein